MMKRPDRKKTAKFKKRITKAFVSELSKRDEPNTNHRSDFDQLLNDAVLGVKQK